SGQRGDGCQGLRMGERFADGGRRYPFVQRNGSDYAAQRFRWRSCGDRCGRWIDLDFRGDENRSVGEYCHQWRGFDFGGNGWRFHFDERRGGDDFRCRIDYVYGGWKYFGVSDRGGGWRFKTDGGEPNRG